MAVNQGFGKQIIWTLVGIITIVITVIGYNLINKAQYQQNYQDINLYKIKDYNLDMSKRPIPYWESITNQEQVENIEKKFNLKLPDIDFGKEMFIISYGSELESLRYNFKEATFKARGKYIGFPYFKQKNSENMVFIYRSDFVPLLDTDSAGYPPNYKGKY